MPESTEPGSTQEFYRIRKLPPYVFAVINEMRAKARAAQQDVIDLGMGNPDGATPRIIVNKMIEAARNPKNHRYSQSKGIARLREEIVKRYKDNYDVDLDPNSEAIVTIGAKDALAHLLFAVVGPDDAVVSPNPAYPIHQYGVIMAEGHACMLPMSSPADFPGAAEASLPHFVAQAEADSDLLPAQSDDDVRRSRFLPRDRRAGARIRIDDRARFRLRRSVLRRLQGSQHSASARGQGSRRRDLLHVEELQHGRLARRFLPRAIPR